MRIGEQKPPDIVLSLFYEKSRTIEIVGLFSYEYKINSKNHTLYLDQTTTVEQDHNDEQQDDNVERPLTKHCRRNKDQHKQHYGYDQENNKQY